MVSLALAIFLGLGQVEAADSPPTQAEIEAAIDGLGSNSFDVREKSSKFLWRAGRFAEGYLEKSQTLAR